ncbi:hypothetical protein V2J09_018022, partial [Rumex salicifolius]
DILAFIHFILHHSSDVRPSTTCSIAKLFSGSNSSSNLLSSSFSVIFLPSSSNLLRLFWVSSSCYRLLRIAPPLLQVRALNSIF